MKEWEGKQVYNLTKTLLLSILVSVSLGSICNHVRAETPLAIDSRIKTFVYSENEIFRIILHYGYQTSIEFANGEEVQTISVGNSFAWQLNPVGRRLFIKPLEENIATNMTIITNLRTYQFELQSKDLSNSVDEELVFVIRFFYPDDEEDQVTPLPKDKTEVDQKTLPVIQPFNFNYKFTNVGSLQITKVFDDGINTFFELGPKVQRPLHFFIRNGSDDVEVIPKQKGKYVVFSKIAKEWKITSNKDVVSIHNNS
ncbi:TrbG/VirB9 family P-type conjugative transfer protein [Rickettsiales endosymbiont of Peranema trichophorum]|uniref:TrbG/VirB9 family P-type conjugative transfer protein n=1 Tax=Rickettsiales endosymbiont of Peranema trichophorum TaxID=2486577 RepID=UPI0013EE455E|nr:TrbG/VirB9 family P-type conjugative transfer protein [Rickettsiales endosymbiont of Peranema trichophorum]